MQYDHEEIRGYLKESEFEDLFTQVLGWDNHFQTLHFVVDDTEYQITAVAQKRGVAIFHCPATTEGCIPERKFREKIHREVSKTSHENLIIYTDTEQTSQIWQWGSRDQDKTIRRREESYNTLQFNEPLIQKLRAIAFSFDEEEQISILDVTKKLKAAFDVEKVTKKFYDHFKKEHDAFLEFLTGIPDEEMQKWYVSVMLNRLMFIYFIQKKGFLNNDLYYLRTKLTETQRTSTDKYYKEFLCPLFFEGFAKPEKERTREMRQLLGKIPYLNGGIFQKHELETLHGEDIVIPDVAFEKLFDFFEKYHWHLDDRRLHNDKEINPDVLGYIFEKYINQKQMGAYYTKEDITEYISKNTIIPFLFDTARKECKIAFEGDASVWKLLQEDPDRYIYDAVKKGVDLDFPEEIAIGIDDVSQRREWNTLAPEEHALPTEIWREVVARKQRYETIKTKMVNGEIDNINDLITYNLNISQFAQDVIANCEGPELLRAFWKAITKVTVLDPTCGSGAFLFAALNILESLYEACLDRMQVFLDEVESSSSRKYKDFNQILNRIAQHPNRKYFVLKSIIINNLYGVDIMEEAIEICKLRLFLKMVAQLEDVRRIEPLPDIDFNIQAGNTLVGFTTYKEIEKALSESFDFDGMMTRIKEKAEDIEQWFKLFRQQQTELGGAVTQTDKQVVQEALEELEDELNHYLAKEYNVDLDDEDAYQSWIDSHKPFHWLVAFYGIIANGGFDVIIGNPPYKEYSKVKKDYKIIGYKTVDCGNLYAMTIEKSFILCNGHIGMIVQLPLVCTDRMRPVQLYFKDLNRTNWFSNFDDRPGKLFKDLQHCRVSIFLSVKDNRSNKVSLYSTKYNRWYSKVRSVLFDGLSYEKITDICIDGSFPKLSVAISRKLIEKLKNVKKDRLSLDTVTFPCYYHNSPQYWIRAMDFVPYFWNERDGEKRSPTIKSLYYDSKLDAAVTIATLNSSLFYWWFIVFSSCRTLTLREIRSFPIVINQMEDDLKNCLSELTADLMQDLKHHSNRKVINKKEVGRIIYDEFFPSNSKPIIDEIDRLLAIHYDFTDEELDFIINYDIKYRMGLGN